MVPGVGVTPGVGVGVTPRVGVGVITGVGVGAKCTPILSEPPLFDSVVSPGVLTVAVFVRLPTAALVNVPVMVIVGSVAPGATG